jgi:hypothetical protein
LDGADSAISVFFFGMILELAKVWDFAKVKKKHETETGNS